MEKNRASMALQILALSVENDKRIEAVDKVIAYIQSTGLDYEVAAFETTIEGDLAQLMEVLEEAIRIASQVDPRIFANVKVHYNAQGNVLSIDEKVSKHR
ncbi:thiamine-binding protein [Facklamia sp. 7083-14-GEN3]|uniref:thiamine-binding protein n=1 Tax=Facklamia sp. 7083-14-GEN3 TaxID=2973478 RepID=UPI00215C10E2|nr:thiamine-binding protein [Facklamia sp. 7083-14-GEN3]MCR8969110.1 thiamine-binding protein [Facklamia sp. 7083-14-GEN3]